MACSTHEIETDLLSLQTIGLIVVILTISPCIYLAYFSTETNCDGFALIKSSAKVCIFEKDVLSLKIKVQIVVILTRFRYSLNKVCGAEVDELSERIR